ncbi:metal ABC transporter solute-binding protein, Zn/Mn family [Viridibacillus arvi]|uniref:metal ABC transporter solute-binding protein, Zn/Mn family n=1 Tax=Viridibacillus arvi TaxID=263475 RepID=UPI00187B37A2|nr:zinc ABC transporter substrate-binding protein [Viridibacillus sp. JNUCC-6]QOV11644.1 zinc ABC transporter substrate-binding protein [Viridibacillus sp. JNUCC-6]
MKKVVIFFTAILILVGCSTKKENDKPVVVTTISQIADAVSVIAGDRVEVKALMGPGVDPHLYKATQGDLSKLESADVIFYSGLHLEGKMLDVFEKMQENDKTVKAISESIEEEKLLGNEMDAKLYDPHVWFDIDIWKTAVHQITDTLSEKYPEYKNEFSENEAIYFKELDDLSTYAKQRIDEIPLNQRVLVTAHDAFNYFGRSLNIEVRGLQGLSTESEYGLKDVRDVVDFLVGNNIKAVFIESSVSDKAMKAVIDGAKEKGQNVKIGGELYSDAMGKEGTEQGTYIGMYKHNVDTIVNSLK